MKTLAALLPFVVVAVASGQSPYDAARSAMNTRMAAEHKAAAGDDKRVWPYVIADKKAGTVTVLACGTPIKPTDPVEFFLTTVASGKDYEALAVTFATPGNVRAALDFIGLVPGWPIDPANDQFWNGGPRVVMTFKAGDAPAVRAESLVTDTDTGKPLPASGLMYTGSMPRRIIVDENTDEPHYEIRRVADTLPDGLIASVYNEPRAILDVPQQAMQTAVYGHRRPSAAYTTKPGEAVEVVLTPAVGKEAVAVGSLEVYVQVVDGKTQYGISVMKGPPFHQDQKLPMGSLPAMVDAIAKAADGTMDLYTTVRAWDDVPVTDLRKLYAVLAAVQQDRGVKLDRPARLPIYPYYRAFFPDTAWQNRDTRLGEPWDLFLTRTTDGKLAAKLERQTEDPDADPPKRVESTPVATPAATAAYVRAHASRWSRTMFVYPPADLTYGELLAWRAAVQDDVPNVFVFPPDGPAK